MMTVGRFGRPQHSPHRHLARSTVLSMPMTMMVPMPVAPDDNMTTNVRRGPG
jgi:hypothetical protein